MRRKISSVAGRFRNIADVKEKVEEVVYGVRDTESLRKGKERYELVTLTTK